MMEREREREGATPEFIIVATKRHPTATHGDMAFVLAGSLPCFFVSCKQQRDLCVPLNNISDDVFFFLLDFHFLASNINEGMG